jgi:hypothetical protein
MIIDCMAFPMGGFIGTTEDGRVFFGKRDPITKKVLEIYEWSQETTSDSPFDFNPTSFYF